MKNFTLSLALLFSLNSYAYLVISDVDDTIKITNSGNIWQAAWRGAFTKDVFPGMIDVYKSWGSEEAKIYFVTASPSILRSKINELLHTYEVPHVKLITRSNVLESKLKYKVREYKKILDAHPNEEAVLVGDDVGQDPEVFAEITRQYPSRVLASYIRPVKNRAALPEQIPYITSFDIATSERSSGRMGFDIIAKTAVASLTGAEDKLLPEFTWCPKDVRSTNLPVVRSPHVIAWNIMERIDRICGARTISHEEVLLVLESR